MPSGESSLTIKKTNVDDKSPTHCSRQQPAHRCPPAQPRINRPCGCQRVNGDRHEQRGRAFRPHVAGEARPCDQPLAQRARVGDQLLRRIP